MNTYLYLKSLRPADRLVIPKRNGLGLIQHHAIYLGNDKNGNRLYIENDPSGGVRVVYEDYLFEDGYEVARVQRFIGSEHQRESALKLAEQLLGVGYNLLHFNCEHFANLIQHGKRYSNQIKNGKIILGVLALLCMTKDD